MISSIVSRLVILLFGTLYPAYASYKAVRTKDVREYVKWMMYWIVFALFTCAETFTDVILGFWFPFYYELKIIVVLWLLSPATKGSSILYRKFVHPTLTKREKEIDEAIMHAKAQGYSTILRLGARGVDYAKYVIMQTAIKGGGGLMNQLRKSYSLSDLTDHHDDPRYRAIGLGSLQEEQDALDHAGGDLRFLRRSEVRSGLRSGSVSSPFNVYFTELDLDTKQHVRTDRHSVVGLPQSMEDVSSGFSSADALFSSSQGSSPISNRGLEDMFLGSSSEGLAQFKSKKPTYSGALPSSKNCDGMGPLMDNLDGSPRSHSYLSPNIISELKNLQSRKVDMNGLIFPQASSAKPSYSKVSENIVTKTNLPCRGNNDLNKRMLCLSGTSFSGASAVYNPSLTYQNPGRSESNSSADVSSVGVQGSKDNAARAGRYKKLRAPGPPSKTTCDTESMSVLEHGTVVKARMSLVSSKRLAGSVNVLFESSGSGSKSALGLDAVPTKITLLKRKTRLNDTLTPSLLLKKRLALLQFSSSSPNLHHQLSTLRLRPNEAVTTASGMKITK